MKKLSQLISQSRSIVLDAIGKASEAKSTPAYLQSLADSSDQIRDAFLAQGNYCYSFLEEAPSVTEVDALSLYTCNYVWANDAKAFLILWRNILFEGKKANIQCSEGLLHPDVPELLTAQSLQKLKDMAIVVTEGLQKETESLRQGKKGGLVTINNWRQQKNPWPVYREQIAQIPAQCLQMVDNFMQIKHSIQVMQGLGSALLGLAEQAENECSQTRNLAEQALETISAETERAESARPASLAARLTHIQEQMVLSNHLGQFLANFETNIEPLPEKIRLIVKARAGMLLTKEVNIKKRIEHWLEANIFPLLYEIWEITESVRSGTKMAVVSACNRAILLAAEDEDQKMVDLRNEALGEALYLFQAKADESKEKFKPLCQLLEERLQKEFKISLIYREAPGLINGATPSSFDQLGQNKFLQDLATWSRKQVRTVQNFIQRVEEEEALSISEKVVRYIESRKGSGADSQYASIFLTRGYIGESFCVGRENEIAHFGTLVKQWKLGYRGSVCLTGNRFSGKSLFGELVTHRYFSECAIRISPGETVRVEGRRLKLSYDLRKALDDIHKITQRRQPLIWIDDLELWWNSAIPLNQNVRGLRYYLDKYSSEMFFLVSMSNALRAFLDRFHHLDRFFQTEINMDQMSAAEIREAIWVRHGATNRKLVDNENKEVNPAQFTRITNRIHRASRGNVGEALNMWSQSTVSAGFDNIRNEFSDIYALPDFISSESGLLLSYIMVQKKTKEYHLGKLFGPVFRSKYAPILKRLLNVGILERLMDGSLEINKAVVNELGELLEDHDYLKYRKWKS